MDEPNTTNQDPLQNGPASDGKSGSTSPRTYTEEEHQQAIKDAQLKAYNDFMAETGRKYKPVEEENKTLKAKMTENQTALDDAQSTIQKLEAQIEELSSSDPDKKKLVSRLKDVEAIERKLKARQTELDGRETELSQRSKTFHASRLAKEHNVDENVLLNLADTVEKMEMLAKILPKKAEDEPKKETPNPHADSGVTHGRAIDYSKMTSTQLIKLGLEQERKRK